MNVLIIYGAYDPAELSDYVDILCNMGVNVQFLQIQGNSWELNNRFLEKISDVHHFILPIMAEEFSCNWVQFLLGYCIRSLNALFLINATEKLLPDLELDRILFSRDLNEFRTFFSHQKLIWEEEKEVQEAKDQLRKKGLYFTPIDMFACIKKEDKQGVELFIKAGLSPNIRDDKGVPVLNRAIRWGFNDIAFLFIEAGSDINLISRDNGNNALMDAAANGNTLILKFLIDRGVEVNILSKSNQTALMMAVGRGDLENIEILLKAGADTEVKDVLGMTAVKYAEILKNEAILALFNK